jgi:hypothetical protein
MNNDAFVKNVASRLIEQIRNGTAPWHMTEFGNSSEALSGTEQKTGLSKFQATSSRTSAGFLNGRNSPRVNASGTEKA